METREILLDLFHAALAAVEPARVVPHHLPEAPRGRTVVVAAGKAAAAMARAVGEAWMRYVGMAARPRSAERDRLQK